MERIDTKHYGRLTLFKNDPAICYWVRPPQDLVWESHLVDLAKKYYRKNSDIIDAGAYIGLLSISFSEIVSKGNKVHAFECQPETFKVLKQNTVNRGNVECYNNILSANTKQRYLETFDLSKDDNYGGRHTFDKSTGKKNEVKDIPTITMDSLKLDNISIYKVDVEGNEMDVLKGSYKTIERCKPFLLIEIMGGCDYSKATKTQLAKIHEVIDYVMNTHKYKKWERISPHDYCFQFSE